MVVIIVFSLPSLAYWVKNIEVIIPIGKDIIKAGVVSLNEKKIYDKFRNRIMFPILDKSGKIIAFSGRVINSSDMPKYMNSPETPLYHKSDVLFNYFFAKKSIYDKGAAILVEGNIDTITLSVNGIENVVAPMGTAATERQIRELWKITDNIIVCFDGDSAGQKASKRLANLVLPIITASKSIKFVKLPKNQDPDDFIKEYGPIEFENLVKSSDSTINLSEFPDGECAINFAACITTASAILTLNTGTANATFTYAPSTVVYPQLRFSKMSYTSPMVGARYVIYGVTANAIGMVNSIALSNFTPGCYTPSVTMTSISTISQVYQNLAISAYPNNMGIDYSGQLAVFGAGGLSIVPLSSCSSAAVANAGEILTYNGAGRNPIWRPISNLITVPKYYMHSIEIEAIWNPGSASASAELHTHYVSTRATSVNSISQIYNNLKDALGYNMQDTGTVWEPWTGYYTYYAGTSTIYPIIGASTDITNSNLKVWYVSPNRGAPNTFQFNANAATTINVVDIVTEL